MEAITVSSGEIFHCGGTAGELLGQWFIAVYLPS